MLSIQTNIASLDAENNLTTTEGQLNNTMAQLSSGYSITSPQSNAAGLAISNDLEADIGSYTQASANANDGLSMVQSSEAALAQDTNILTTLRELAMQSSSSGVDDSQRGYVDDEAQQLISELQQISQVTQYNGVNLLQGSAGASTLTFQVGIANGTNDQISFTAIDATVGASGLNVSGLSLASQASAQAALSVIDNALSAINSDNATLGALGNRLQSSIDNIQAFSQSLTSADSQIKDVDVASATAQLSEEQVLEQAGISVLAQANQTPQLALKLLQ